MRGLFVFHSAGQSGACNSLHLLVQGLVGKLLPQEETIVVLPSPGYYLKWYQRHGHPCFRIDKSPEGGLTGGRLRRAIAILRGRAEFCLHLLWLIRRVRPDFVYVNTFCNSGAYLAARLSRVPVIWHIREADSIMLAEGALYEARRRLLRTFRGPIVAVSHSVAGTVRRVHPKARINVVYNGIQLPDVAGPRHSDGPVTVGFSGSIVERKGIHTLVEAFRLVQPHNSHSQLLLAGPVLDEGYYGRLHGMLVRTGGRVHFLGQVQDMAAFYRELDIFVLPSLDEPFSRSLLEAMAYGLPVIASDVGGNREAVEDGVSGFLFRAGDAKDLARKLEWLMTDSDLRRCLGQQARKRVQERFSLEQYVDSVARVIREAVSGTR